MRKLLFALLYLGYSTTFAQEPDVKYYELIANDSLHFYFNNVYKFTEKDCAYFVRKISLEGGESINGKFQDEDENGVITAKGGYNRSLLHGRFEYYYPTGQLKARGLYRLGTPIGRWEFYFPNGRLESVWTRTNVIEKLVEKYDEDGTPLVMDGAGTYTGKAHKTMLNSGGYNFTGTIKTGLMDGEWVGTTPEGKSFVRETYNMGQFVEGQLEIVKSNIQSYYDRPELYIFPFDYVLMLDKHQTEPCNPYSRKQSEFSDKDKEVAEKRSPPSRFDAGDIRYEIRMAIRSTINSYEGSGVIDMGEYELVIKFDVDSEGKAENFERVSPWGKDYYRRIRRVLGRVDYSVFKGRTIYFKMNIQLNGNRDSFQFSYRFTRSRDG